MANVGVHSYSISTKRASVSYGFVKIVFFSHAKMLSLGLIQVLARVRLFSPFSLVLTSLLCISRVNGTPGTGTVDTFILTDADIIVYEVIVDDTQPEGARNGDFAELENSAPWFIVICMWIFRSTGLPTSS